MADVAETSTIKRLLKEGKSRDEIAQIMVDERIAATVGDARFLIAFDLGETDGDLIQAERNDTRA